MEEVFQRVEHTRLSTDTTGEDIVKLCNEAKSFGFRGVCVPPFFVKKAATSLKDEETKVITVIDFPFGYSHTIAKTEAIKKVADQGAHGVDVVINYMAAINGSWHHVEDDINTVVHKARMTDLEIKLIIELGAYSSRILKQVVELCKKAEPDYVKTNTGMMGHIVEIDQLKLLMRLLDGHFPVKASGGIRSMDDAQALINEGAQILGASSAINW